jgi:hypothetical protein
MRRPQGYAFQTDRETGEIVAECDTFTCSHCHMIVHVKPMCDPADMGGHCCACNGMICPSCAYLAQLGKPCLPFVERVNRLNDRMEHGGVFIDPMSGELEDGN